MSIAQCVANLDAWLDSMRGPDGYGGPVVHWWQNCLNFTGAGLDWRYEGIITGYLTLWRRTGQPQWLAKARQAGEDLVSGLLPSGNFRNSNFEQNPCIGGTPHEAAASLGLLRLAQSLRDHGFEGWSKYSETAERNLHCYFVARLWDGAAGSFRDMPGLVSFVPNKACTLVEALFAMAKLHGSAELIERYGLLTLQHVIDLQVKTPGRLAGAIPQNSINGDVVTAYYPYYIARCIPALLLAYDHTGNTVWMDAAAAASEFIIGQLNVDGYLPQVLYTRGENLYPQWIAPLGDVLCVLQKVSQYTPISGASLSLLEKTVLEGVLLTGGIATARGFGAQISQRYQTSHLPEFRDNIPVVGWVDKAFAYLAGQVPENQPLPLPQTSDLEQECSLRGRPVLWQETATTMRMTEGDKVHYAWHKGEPWAKRVSGQMWK